MMLAVENEKDMVKEIKEFMEFTDLLQGVSKPFLLKGQKVTILGFCGYTIFVANTLWQHESSDG